MPTVADWKAALAANPRDPSLWLLLAEYLKERPDAWEREKCSCKSGAHGRGHCQLCNNTGLVPAMTAHRARLTWWGLMMEDEAWHGVEDCRHCYVKRQPDGTWIRVGCINCNKGKRPTFALLFDREGEECNVCEGSGFYFTTEMTVQPRPCGWCIGKRIIPGHASELSTYMESEGDGRAAKVREIRVKQCGLSLRWSVHPHVPGSANSYPTYPVACREAIRRIRAVFTELCDCCGNCGNESARRAMFGDGECPKCFGLGWLATLPT